jgi:hypothetical protein
MTVEGEETGHRYGIIYRQSRGKTSTQNLLGQKRGGNRDCKIKKRERDKQKKKEGL